MAARILVVGDILRPQDEAFRASQNGNTQWLHRLLRRPLAAASGLEVATLLWGGTGGFDTPAFYALAGVSPDIEGWVGLYDAPDLPREAAAMLAAAFDNTACVIGFELPPLLKRILERLGVLWIDLNIHPYRFGPDVLFAIQTQDAEVLAALAAHHAPDSHFEPFADLVAATAVKLPPLLPVQESTLIIGQTRIDRALIRAGALVDLAHFAAPLHAAIGPRGRVLFKPHPYNPGGFGLHDIALPLARIREVSENIYVLLAQDSVRRVIGVSSSVVAEARLFGKEGIFLGTPPMRIAPDRAALAPGLHASVPQAWLWADFWRDLLAPLLAVTAQDGNRPILPPDALRGSLRQFWGHDELTHQLPWDLAAARDAERRLR
jgi:hypothetical protein